MGARTNTICALATILAMALLPATVDAKRKQVEEPPTPTEVDNSWCEDGQQGAYVDNGVLYILGKARDKKWTAMQASDRRAQNILEGIARNAYITEELTLIKPSSASSVTLDATGPGPSYDACTQYVFDPTDAFVGNTTVDDKGQEVRGDNYLTELITEVLNDPGKYQPQSPQQAQLQTLIE